MCHSVENISTEKGVGVGHLVSILSLISGATSKMGGRGGEHNIQLRNSLQRLNVIIHRMSHKMLGTE